MLAEPDRTRYDLNFRLFGFPVRVHPLFWLLSAVFGAEALETYGLVYLLAWVGLVFVSILVHELGHALAFRLFGADSHIVLYSFGGLAVPWASVRGRWQRVVVSLAGPAAGFVLYGLVYGSNVAYPWAGRGAPHLAGWLYDQLVFVNLAWGLVNLLPVWPLDGGQVAEEVCSYFAPRTGRQVALQISVAVAGLLSAYSLACVVGLRQGAEWLTELPPWLPLGSPWTALLFGMLAYQSYQYLQQLRWTGSHWREDDAPPWR